MASDQASNTDGKQYAKRAGSGRTGDDDLSGGKIDQYNSAGFTSADKVVPKADAHRTPGSDKAAG